MRRDVSAHLALTVEGPVSLLFSTAVSGTGPTLDERLTLRVDGQVIEPIEFPDHYGSRLHQITCWASRVEFDYAATVLGQADVVGAEPIDLVTFLRPSRYCESDALAPTAEAEFGDLEGHDLLAAVAGWVHEKLDYVAGSSLATDGAVRTLLARQGVCRDFAHLTIALLRARDVPARLVSVYAPGLAPMDFHAVCEAWVGGAWHLVDATWLAPRQTLLRIATGRDAADTAFLTNNGADLLLDEMEVTAVADQLPDDDWSSLVQLR
ncbi:MAG: transglutaminase family protein [Lapillicoccus sp.]